MIVSAKSLSFIPCRRLYVRYILFLGCFVPAILCGVPSTPWVVDSIPSILEVVLVLVSEVGLIGVLPWFVRRDSREFRLGGDLLVILLSLQLCCRR